MASKSYAKRQQPKRQQLKKRSKIIDSSGWTHVVNGRGNVVNANNLSSPHVTLRMVDRIPLDQVAEIHARFLECWESSDCWKTFADLYEKVLVSYKHLRLTNCVCLGLGSISEGRDSSRHELAALVSMLNLLGKRHTIKDVVFQDPVFNDVDKAFLTKLGYSVVSTPLGFESIDENTFCFAPHLENEVFAEALKGAYPALCIGNSDVEADRPLHSSANDFEISLDIFRRFTKATNSNKLPEYDRDSWCHFTSIYWLRNDSA